MPTLRDLIAVVERHAGGDLAGAIEREIRLEYGGERVYIIPHDSRKDPSKAARARELSRKLPTGIVAQRLGVHVSTVYRAVKR